MAKKTENVPRMVHQYTCFSERITAIFISFLPLDTNNDKTRQSTQKQMEVVRKLNTPDTVFFYLPDLRSLAALFDNCICE